MFYACRPDGHFLFLPHFLEAADGIRPGLLRVDVHLRIVDVRPSMTVAGAGKQRLQMWASMMRGLANAASISLPIRATVTRRRYLPAQWPRWMSASTEPSKISARVSGSGTFSPRSQFETDWGLCSSYHGKEKNAGWFSEFVILFCFHRVYWSWFALFCRILHIGDCPEHLVPCLASPSGGAWDSRYRRAEMPCLPTGSNRKR